MRSKISTGHNCPHGHSIGTEQRTSAQRIAKPGRTNQTVVTRALQRSKLLIFNSRRTTDVPARSS
jgi:hypothetical protein